MRAWGLVEQAEVQFVVAVPDTAADQSAEILCPMSIDGWPEKGRPLKKIAPGLYAGTWSLPMGQLVEYKFTRGAAWATVEKTADGGELPNRTYVVRGGVSEQSVMHIVARWADRTNNPARSLELNTPGSGAPVRAATRTGDIRAHHRVFSPQLRNERTVLVYLPPGYDNEPERRYPVLYMQDGNNIFDAATSFTGVEWGMDEAAEKLIAARKITPLIIVAIYNNEQRVEEYTPFVDSKHGGGRGEEYVAFLCDTLKPLIDKTYRTRPEATSTGIGGSSLGGLISLYAITSRPDVFSRAAIVSPALWWADQKILNFVTNSPPGKTQKVWIDIGSAEGATTDNGVSPAVEQCRRLVVGLEGAGLRQPDQFRFEIIDGGRHHESAWAARVGDILEYLYPPKAAEEPKVPDSAPASAPRAAPPGNVGKTPATILPPAAPARAAAPQPAKTPAGPRSKPRSKGR